MKLTYLSLGSNLGDRENNLAAALDLLTEGDVHVEGASPVYETEPVEYRDQDWFLNQVIEVRTALTPRRLLALIAKIERELERVRDIPKGPRTIDIDILFYDQAVINAAQLQVPHPRIAERRFVLVPLADLAPELRHPVTGQSVREMLETAPPAVVRLLHS